MRSKIIKKIFQYSGIAGLAFSAGCSYINSAPKPNLLDEYPTISHKSSALLEKPSEDINVRIISEKVLPIYQSKIEKSSVGEFDILKYHSRNITPDSLKKTLEEQLKNSAEVITSISETNQILIKIKRTSGLEKQVEDLIGAVDVAPPQIMLDLRVVKIFADYTKDKSSLLNLKPKDSNNLYPSLLANLPGASLRTPERGAEKGLGVEYGIVGEVGSYLINAQLDQLQSQGFAEDLATTSLTVSNGKKAEIRLTQELPYINRTFQGGTIFETTEYKVIDNFLEITPFARDDGNIFLDIGAGVGSYNPTGVLQIPGIVKRNVKIEGVEIKQGETIILGGFKIDHALGIERADPIFSKIPIIGNLFKANDEEKSRNEVLFIATPHYVDVNQE